MAGELIFEDKEAIHVTEFLSNEEKALKTSVKGI
jgi:hypothetical protein